jgi:two-component system sensor histidine kinase RegB
VRIRTHVTRIQIAVEPSVLAYFFAPLPDPREQPEPSATVPSMFDLEPTITLPWLVRLRWLFAAGQLGVWVVLRFVLGNDSPLWPFALASGVLAASNLALVTTLAGWPPARLMGGVLLVDTVLLTVQLAALGGATNPFTVFYLVYITLSAVVLSARWTTAVALLAIAGFALLFAVPAEMHVHHKGSPLFNPHLRGMWAAFVLAAVLTAFFVRRISRAIATQREQITTLRETAARNARHASLATLAAGAAHELNNPMSTIAVAAHEACLRAKQLGATAVVDDLELILGQIDRCQQILHQMAARAAPADADARLSTDELVVEIERQLGERADQLDVRAGADSARLALPAAPTVQSLVALIKNALDASRPDAKVTLEIRRDDGAVAISVEDRGDGIPDDVLAKIGEPFFTTKPPGRGLGLGVFLARTFFESHGGALAIESKRGVGTRATARLPLEATA